MERKRIHFGLIGLGLMGREFASAIARWCHLLGGGPVPVLRGICDPAVEKWAWFTDNFDSVGITTPDYRELLASDDIHAVYCAVPHNLHEKIYSDIIRAGKHLLGEKPFGIDLAANARILEAARSHPGIIVRCNSEFPYFPGAQKLIRWAREKNYGRILEVSAAFNHSSDIDPEKPINWKRMAEFNGEYGCMGDLGFHTHQVPLRLGWMPSSVFASLQNITGYRPDPLSGKPVKCDTWDNASLVCECTNPEDGRDFILHLHTRRMSPGSTNDWSIEILGTHGSARFSTRDPRSFYSLQSTGREQGWTRLDLGSQSVIPSVTGHIFEFGFSDAFQQMMGAFMHEFSDHPERHPFRAGFPEETRLSHLLMTGALESHKTGRKIWLASSNHQNNDPINQKK